MGDLMIVNSLRCYMRETVHDHGLHPGPPGRASEGCFR